MDKNKIIERIQFLTLTLEELAKSDDYESAHAKADDLLIYLIEYFAEYNELEFTVSRAVEAYRNLTKWYA